MAEPMLRIAALYERDECRQVEGSWCIPLSALGALLEGSGYRLVGPPEPERKPPAMRRSEERESGCGCATLDDCQRRGCAQERRCNCATLDDCLRRGCR